MDWGEREWERERKREREKERMWVTEWERENLREDEGHIRFRDGERESRSRK